MEIITKKEVKHIGKLARLYLKEEEIDKFQKEFSLILDYIKILEEVDVSQIKPTSHPFQIKNIVREDELVNQLGGEKERLIKLMPQTKNNYLKVKPIF